MAESYGRSISDIGIYCTQGKHCHLLLGLALPVGPKVTQGEADGDLRPQEPQEMSW